MRRLVALLLVLAGCDSVFGLGETEYTGGGDAPASEPDGALDAALTCTGNLCPASCLALQQTDPSAPSGVYTLDAGLGAFAAYCDQTGDGGGWTLALKIDGRERTFSFEKAIWENEDLLATSSPDRDHTEAKLETWNAIAFTEIRIGFEYPIDSGPVRYLVIPLAAARMKDLFATTQQYTTMLGRTAWKGLIGPDASLETNCNKEGTNLSGGTSMQVRIGLLANNESDCITPDSRIGIGGGGGACGGPTTQTAGNTACYASDNGTVELPAFAWVYVR